MSTEEFWLMEPDSLPNKVYEVVRSYPCYGMPLKGIITVKKTNIHEVEFNTFSPTILALLACNGIKETFYNSNSKRISIVELMLAYSKGYNEGYKECKELIQGTYIPK